MNIQDRIKIALGALAGRDVIGQQLQQFFKEEPGVQKWGAYGQAKSPDTRLEPLVKAGWRRNELIFACVSTKAETASQVQLRVINKRQLQEQPESPLQKLLDRPNPMMNQSDMWKATLILQDFAGNMYFEKVRSGAGRTVELWPMRPDWMRAQEDDQGRIAGWWYHIPEKTPKFFLAADILSFRLYDPINGLFGYPPVAVCARSGDMDNSVTDYVRLLFEEGGVPPGILTSSQSINAAVAQEIRDMWMMRYGGVKQWTKGPAVLGNDTKYQATGLGLKEMGIDLLDERNESKICMTLKVPAVIVGTKFGLERATLDNVKGYQKNWWQNILMPIYKSYGDVLRQQLVPEFGENQDVAWDFAEVPALQDDLKEKRTRALEAFSKGAITRNQFNAEWGLPDYGPAGEVYVMSSLLVEIPAPPVRETVKVIEGHLSPEHKHQEKGVDELPHEKQRGKFERKLKGAVIDYFGDQLKRIEKNLRALTTRKIGKQAKQEHPQLPGFWQEEGEILYKILFEILTDATVAAARDAFSTVTVDVGISWNLINEKATQWAAEHTQVVVAKMSKTSMAGFITEFEPWLESGEPLDALIKRLEPYYGQQRAEWVGVSETTRAFANGNINTWKEMGGFVESFDVLTAEDDRVCPICVDQKERNPHGLDDERPSFHVSCRCAVRPNVRND